VAIGSNVAIPVPWPWLRPESWGGAWAVFWWVLGLFFLAVPVFLAFAAFRIPWMRRAEIRESAVFIAAACVTLPYAHHTFSRADWMHLTHSAAPLVLGLLALPIVRPWPVLAAAALLADTLCAMLPNVAAFDRAVAPRLRASPHDRYVERVVDGAKMEITGASARVLDAADRLVGTLSGGQTVMFAPHWPGLYAALNARSPVTHLYFTRPTPGLDAVTIAEMERSDVRWLMLQDYALDGRDDLRFRNTNPAIFEFVRERFEEVPDGNVPPDAALLRRRD
jgi:hypothetical protein